MGKNSKLAPILELACKILRERLRLDAPKTLMSKMSLAGLGD